MFETWMRQEEAAIRAKYGKARLLTLLVTLLLVLQMLSSLVLLLDGGGLLEAGTLVFLIGVAWLVLSLGDYRKRFLKPLRASLQQELSTEAEREAFAQQMQSPQVIEFRTFPQGKTYLLKAGPDYCYTGQPRTCGIFRTCRVRRVLLEKEWYSSGTWGHVRTCWSLTLLEKAEKKPLWKGCFLQEAALYQARDRLCPLLGDRVEMVDQVEAGKTEKGRQAARRSGMAALAFAAALLAALYLLTRFLRW